MAVEDGHRFGPPATIDEQGADQRDFISPEQVRGLRRFLQNIAQMYGSSLKSIEQMHRFLESAVRVMPDTDRSITYHSSDSPPYKDMRLNLGVVMGEPTSGFAYDVWLSRVHKRWMLHFRLIPPPDEREMKEGGERSSV